MLYFEEKQHTRKISLYSDNKNILECRSVLELVDFELPEGRLVHKLQMALNPYTVESDYSRIPYAVPCAN